MSIYTGEWTSRTLNMNVTTRVIFPDSPFDLEQKDTRPKTMYLLNGGGGSSGDWPRFTSIEFYARLYNFTIVLADAFTSFYTNMKYGGQYFDFFTKELPEVMNEKFRLPEDTYIVGQSMGGYGCVKLGLSEPEKYKAIGCFSGGLDLKALCKMKGGLNNSGQLNAVFGDPMELKDKDDCFYLARKVKEEHREIPIIMYCGTEDFIFEMSEKFDAYLTEIGYEHEYHKGPGVHMWDYWDHKMPEMMERLCGIK